MDFSRVISSVKNAHGNRSVEWKYVPFYEIPNSRALQILQSNSLCKVTNHL